MTIRTPYNYSTAVNVMATPSRALQTLRCSFPGCPVPVRIHFSLIETLEGIVRKGGGGEQGILYGQLDGTGTVVESTYALEAFVIEKMRQAVAKVHGPVVGFYRIREGNSRELTPEETNLAMALFAKPGAVILLVERRAEGPRANAFFFDHGAFVSLPRGRQFPLDVGILIEREARRRGTGSCLSRSCAASVRLELSAPGGKAKTRFTEEVVVGGTHLGVLDRHLRRGGVLLRGAVHKPAA